MANTKSAEQRVRQSARRNLRNNSVKNRLKTLQTSYMEAVNSGNKDKAAELYRTVTSAFDKAAKRGIVPKATASRKKSRLSAQLKKAAAAPAAS